MTEDTKAKLRKACLEKHAEEMWNVMADQADKETWSDPTTLESRIAAELAEIEKL